MQHTESVNRTVDPWTERAVRWLYGPMWLRHFVIWQIGLLVLIVLTRVTGGGMDNLIVASAFTMVGFIMTYVPCHVAAHIEDLDVKWKRSPLADSIEVDWIAEGRKALSFKANLRGVVVIIPVVGYFYWWTELFTSPEPWFGSSIANLYWTGLWTMGMLVSGWCTSMVLNILKLPQLLDFDQNSPPSPWEHHMQPLRMMSMIFFSIALYGALIITCIMVVMLYFPIEINIIIIVMAGLVGVIDLFAFIYPQTGVHKVLKQYKEYHMRELAPALDDALARVTEDATIDNLGHFEQLAAMHDRINELEVWPFNVQQLSTVMASVIIPGTVFIFQLFFSGDA
ncbi:MAG TPA: hypothetical protein EYQ80_00425 [Candidatus Poseidoniales archaeon]|nr:hypothetical protein [Candidatus Poseidoniales archaeon]